MLAINQDLGLHNGDKAILLADARISRKVLCSDVDGKVGRCTLLDINLEGCAPLCKACTLFIILASTLSKVIKASAPCLALAATGQWFKASVDFDAWDDAIAIEHINEWLAFRVLLVQRLFKENGTRDILTNAFSGEQKVAPRHAIFLVVYQTNCLEAFANSACGLIASQQTFAWLDHRGSSLTKLICILASVYWCCVRSGHHARSRSPAGSSAETRRIEGNSRALCLQKGRLGRFWQDSACMTCRGQAGQHQRKLLHDR
mmetsp:Transcript_112716/g.206864  ORF Transcript_112716/g.206864 Transcript_112716/m.206864 type:complete len:260 (+) Transcript_112716:778-1557(+)